MTKKHVLLGSVSALAVGLMIAPAFAQEAVETVVVTGIRASLQSAQAIKQNSDQVVDSITSVDIGALPDRNIAEALQRVPGVTLQRSDTTNDLVRMGSTGNAVFIRGLSWVKSLVNGRDEFTAKSGRSLSFGDVSADLMQSVNVYKSTTADQIEGGVGGTVDLVTRKPFDQDGFKLAVSGDWTYGTLADKAIPSGNFLITDRWHTGIGEFGALFSVDWQDVTNRTSGINLAPYSCWDTTASSVKAPKDDGYSTCTALSSSEKLLAPQGWGLRQMEFSQQRLASNVVLQWRPTEALEISLFAMNTYAHNVDTEHYAYMAISQAQATAGTYKDGYWVGGQSTLSNIDTRAGAGHNRNTDISLNVKYNPTDRLEITTDLQAVESASPYRNMTYYVKPTVAPTVTIDASSDDPTISVENLSSNAAGSNYIYPQAMDHLEYNVGHALNARVDGSYTFDGDGLFGYIKKVKMGARTEQKQAVQRATGWNWAFVEQGWLSQSGQYVTLDGTIHSTSGSFISANGNTYTSNTGALATAVGASSKYTFAKIFGNSIPTLYAVTSAFAGMNTLQSGKIMQAYEPGDLYSWYAGTQNWAQWTSFAATHGCTGDDATCLAAYDNTPGSQSSSNTKSKQNEQTFAGYFQVDFAHDTLFGYDIPFDGNIGVRVVRTEDQISAGQLVMPYLNVGACTVGTGSGQSTSCDDWNKAFAFLGSTSTSSQTIARPAVSNGYTNALPSFNFRAKLSDTVQARVAYYETIVRPAFDKTYSSANLSFNFNDATSNQYGVFKSDPSGYGGNPYLKPMHATNYDLSLEWYFNASDSLTFSLFHKDLSNYVYTSTTSMPIADPVTKVVMNFNYTTYVNGDKGKVEGFELAYQKFFDSLPGIWSGLGFQANYTKIYNSGGHNAGSDITNSVALAAASDKSLPIEGMSNDSYNLALIYNKYGIDARLAYNWRSSFLSSSSDANAKIPVWLENYGQLDGSLFYDFWDHYKVGLQVTNILALPFYTDMGYKDFHPRVNFIQADRKFAFVWRANW